MDTEGSIHTDKIIQAIYLLAFWMLSTKAKVQIIAVRRADPHALSPAAAFEPFALDKLY